jgi:hypothetical protein
MAKRAIAAEMVFMVKEEGGRRQNVEGEGKNSW